MSENDYRVLCRKYGINDEERRLWILNLEPLYRWWRASGLGIYSFIKLHREDIGRVILAELNC